MSQTIRQKQAFAAITREYMDITIHARTGIEAAIKAIRLAHYDSALKISEETLKGLNTGEES